MTAKPARLALVPRGFVLWIRLPQRIRHGSQAALEQDWRNLKNRGQKVSTSNLWGQAHSLLLDIP